MQIEIYKTSNAWLKFERNGATALMAAALKGKTQIARMLITNTNKNLQTM